MPLMVGGDDLYCHEPFILQLREPRLPYVLVCQPGSHRELYDEMAALERLGAGEEGQWHEGPACRASSCTIMPGSRIWT